MQTKREKIQARLMLLPPLEELIPQDHHLWRLNRVLDLGFIHEAVREYYCQDNGRGSIDPEVVVRLFLLQAIEGIERVRDLMRQVQVNLAYRWFIGYELDEKLPDHSTLSRALDRFGDEVFDKLFRQSIAQCKRSGLVEGRVLHLDATSIRADIDKNKVAKEGSSDPDARFGRFPDGKLLPGYKQQTAVDDKSRVIVGLEVVPADNHESQSAIEAIDQAAANLGANPEAVCADAAYASGANAAALEERGVRLVSPPPKPLTYTADKYFTVEAFKYDEEQDIFTCPAGEVLKNIGPSRKRPGQYLYKCGSKICGRCWLKDKCTQARYRQLQVSADHAALIRLREDSQTESFKRLYRTRAPGVEGIFAEAKCWHGLRRAWRRGLSNMRLQCLLVAAALNFKRLAGLFLPQRALNKLFIFIFIWLWQIWHILMPLWRPKTKYNLAYSAN